MVIRVEEVLKRIHDYSLEEIKKKQKRVMIYVMIISLICVVGVSYAFFTAGMSSETSTTVRADAGTMKITTFLKGL